VIIYDRITIIYRLLLVFSQIYKFEGDCPLSRFYIKLSHERAENVHRSLNPPFSHFNKKKEKGKENNELAIGASNNTLCDTGSEQYIFEKKNIDLYFKNLTTRTLYFFVLLNEIVGIEI